MSTSKDRRPFMSHLGRNDCTGKEQYLHFDGEYSRIVDFNSDEYACAYRDQLSSYTPFLPLASAPGMLNVRP